MLFEADWIFLLEIVWMLERVVVISLVFLLISQWGWSQCESAYPQNQSAKIANYDIEVDLDHEGKIAYCTQTLRWKNTSPDTIKSLRFYMYMNSFKDMKSSYLINTGGKIFGRDIADRGDDEWGHITVDEMYDAEGTDLVADARYIQPDDGLVTDQSILEVPLSTPILPNTTGVLDMKFTTKMPKTIARSGYSRHDFFLFVHWFPQVCVYEQKLDGNWGWNSHQFVQGTEFFADFGDYNVSITASDHLQIGASGCMVSESSKGEKQRVEFQAHDLIDFGFVVYSDFDVYRSTSRGVDIEILMPPEHSAFAPRYLMAIEHGLAYLETNVGKYPYPKITVVDPPVHALSSGFMEYPMMITAASFYGIPASVRSVESLVIHEFCHMYFMGTLASNEKEAPWLDEGFVTYYEDRVTDHYHGDNSSLFNVLGFRSGNAENSRLEYTRLDHSTMGPIAQPGWEIRGSYKGLIYAKTSTVLRTLEGLVGRDLMDRLVQKYFEEYKFSHPREQDFRRVATEVLEGADLDFDLDFFFEQCLHGTETCDYEVESMTETSAKIGQKGGLIFPVDIEIGYQDGSNETLRWNGKGTMTVKATEGRSLKSIHIDPERKINLDINFNNNSMSVVDNRKVKAKYSAKASNWLQTAVHFVSTFF